MSSSDQQQSNAINSISNRAITEQKDLETEDEDDMKNIPNPNSELDQDENVMSNEEFARRAEEFRRSGAFLRRRTNIRLTMGSAEHFRNQILSTRRQIQTIINGTNPNNISNVGSTSSLNRQSSSNDTNNNTNTNLLSNVNENDNNSNTVSNTNATNTE